MEIRIICVSRSSMKRFYAIPTGMLVKCMGELELFSRKGFRDPIDPPLLNESGTSLSSHFNTPR